MNPTEIKNTAYAHCQAFVSEKIQLLRKQLDDLRESIMLDTKSTAGDKHETGRAHLQIEQEQISRQLATALDQQSALNLIDVNQHTEMIITGSLVRTDNGCYFLCIAAPKMIHAGETIIPLSVQSPLGSQLKGKKPGDSLMLNGKTILVKEVL